MKFSLKNFFSYKRFARDNQQELIPFIDCEQLYKLRRADILSIVHAESSRLKFDRANLEHRYIDALGNNYSGFPDHVSLPVQRYGMMKYFLMWMTSSISPEEMRGLCDAMSEALAKGVSNPKNAARIGVLIEEIRQREKMTLHTELLLNFLAVQWVRQDEDPLVYNNQIQLEKVDALQAETGNPLFFFRQKELKRIYDSYRMSDEEWNKYWTESLQNQQFLKALRMRIASLSEEEKEDLSRISSKA